MRLGLVLSGGGAKAAFEAGVFAAMQDQGLRPQVVSGTSAGALNAAGVAAGFDAGRLAQLWASVSDADVYEQRRDVWRLLRPAGLFGDGNLAERLLDAVGWTWLWDPAPLRATVVRALGGERVPVVDGTVLAVSAVEVASGRLVRFTSAEPPPQRRSDRFRVGPLDVDHLLASAAIPLLFRPARVADVAHWDGGIVANTPIAPAMAYEPDAVIVVTTSTPDDNRPEPLTLAETVSRLVDAVQRFTLEADLARAEAVNLVAEAAPGATPKRKVELLVIGPGTHDLGDTLHFEPAKARRLVEIGHEVAAQALAGWRVEDRLP